MRSAETLVQADDPAGMVAKLAEQKIIVTKKPRGIRVATHFFNNEEDIERLIEALYAEALSAGSQSSTHSGATDRKSTRSYR